MKIFAERLKIAIEKRGLSQARAARQCGISQQSMNYIITNSLRTSKLAPQIASTLGINPEWLIYGKGKFEETKVYELPIIHSPYMLNKFLKNELDENTVGYTTGDTYLGKLAFAYVLEQKKMAICCKDSDVLQNSPPCQYLTIDDSSVTITDEKGDFSFLIFEWRTRYGGF